MQIEYRFGNNVELSAVIELYRASIQLLRRTQSAADPGTLLLFLPAPAARRCYPRVGFTPYPQACIVAPRQEVPPG